MKKLTILVMLLFITMMSFSTTYYHSGTISSDETWYSFDVHYVSGDIVVSGGVTLTIQAGTLVTINCTPAIPPGSTVTYGISVIGTIYAVGTSSDYITFTPSNTSSGKGWKGIQFPIDNARETSELRYCILEYAWKPSSASLTVTNCGAALFIKNRSTVIVEYCKIHNNSAYRGGGIFIYECSPTVRLNQIYSNDASEGAGIYMYQNGASYTLLNNLIYKNEAEYDGGGIYCNQVDLTLNYCTIADNSANMVSSTYDGGGVYLNGSSSIISRNTILYDNMPDQAYPAPDNTDYNYCCIQDLSSPSSGNINDDPEFVDASTDNYRISDDNSSPCIDAGDKSVAYTTYDVFGNTRYYNMGASEIDMGAHENNDEDIRKSGESYVNFTANELNIYPNPTKYGYSTVLLTLESDNFVEIKIINLHGQIVKQLENGWINEGDHVYFVETDNLNRGIYFVKYQISNQNFAKKLIIQ